MSVNARRGIVLPRSTIRKRRAATISSFLAGTTTSPILTEIGPIVLSWIDGIGRHSLGTAAWLHRQRHTGVKPYDAIRTKNRQPDSLRYQTHCPPFNYTVLAEFDMIALV